jgi:ATP-binding protein involved in chromosome partitioning
LAGFGATLPGGCETEVETKMSASRDDVLACLSRIALPDGGTLVSRDMIRALSVADGEVRFVIEAPDAGLARRMEPVRAAAEAAVRALPGIARVSAVLTAHSARGTETRDSFSLNGISAALDEAAKRCAG